MAAEVSARHLSFLETGRAGPSREMVIRLAAVLDLPSSWRDELLLAAGFAPERSAASSKPLGRTPVLAELAFETAARFETAKTPAELIEIARPMLRELGLDYFYCGTLRSTPGHSPGVSVEVEPAGVFPKAWMERYFERAYLGDDPLARELLRSHQPFFWDEVERRRGSLRPVEKRILNEAGDFRIYNGFVGSVRRADGAVRAVSMMGERVERQDPNVRLAAHMVGLHLIDGLERLAGAVGPGRRLQAGALECLKGVGRGKSVAEIAERLRLPDEEVRRRLRAACVTLRVRTRAHAVSRAVSLGLLREA